LGRLGTIGSVPQHPARRAFDTGEDFVNPISNSLSVPAPAGVDDATTFLLPRNGWPGLAHASGQLGVPLDADALSRFAQYRDLLLERSAQFNLTAIRDPDEVEHRLFLDAIAMAPLLDRLTDVGASQCGRRIRLVDIGAGAGFPGLPLKIVRPALEVTLIDATGKKVAFVNEVISRLGLDAAGAVQGRAEDLGQEPAYRAQFDVATARAVAALPVLMEYVIPFLRVGGTALLPKGLQIAEELRMGENAAGLLGAKIVSAAELPVETTRLVVVRKLAPTPVAYPRRTGIPGRDPLGERH